MLLLAVEHQIAQKLHACTTPNRHGGNDRAHDLVDLQILVECDPPDLVLLANIGRRLFAARRVTPWPPTVTIFPSWEQIYTQSADGLDVRSLPDAVVWANILIDQANASASDRPWAVVTKASPSGGSRIGANATAGIESYSASK